MAKQHWLWWSLHRARLLCNSAHRTGKANTHTHTHAHRHAHTHGHAKAPVTWHKAQWKGFLLEQNGTHATQIIL